MIFGDLSIIDATIIIAVTLFLIILFFGFIWFVREVRSIAENSRGFIKFGQIAFIGLSWGVFFIILFYYLFNPRETISPLNVFLTVIIGFLGTGIGFFFSGPAVKHLEDKVKGRGERMVTQVEILEDTKDLIKENIDLNKEKVSLGKKLEKYEKSRG